MAYERVNIYITAKEKRRLEKLSFEGGLSVAELVRRAIDAYLDQEEEKIRARH